MSQKGQRLPHQKAAALFHEQGSLQTLMAALAYQFTDHGLLLQALTHSTAHPRKNNQRLEFLGDAVLQLVISQLLFEQRKDQEGQLTFARQKLVNEQALAAVAREIGLGQHLKLGSSFAKEGGARQDSVLADAMEAVLAAIYLDGGLEAAAQVISRLWAPLISQADASLDSKGSLQAHFQAKGMPEPEYVDIEATGPPHKRVFTVAVKSYGRELARGLGSTKRQAQQQAAQAALNLMEGGE